MKDTPEQIIADLRTAIDYALTGDLLDAAGRLGWLGQWRQGDKMRERIAADLLRLSACGQPASEAIDGAADLP